MRLTRSVADMLDASAGTHFRPGTKGGYSGVAAEAGDCPHSEGRGIHSNSADRREGIRSSGFI